MWRNEITSGELHTASQLKMKPGLFMSVEQINRLGGCVWTKPYKAAVFQDIMVSLVLFVSRCLPR